MNPGLKANANPVTVRLQLPREPIKAGGHASYRRPNKALTRAALVLPLVLITNNACNAAPTHSVSTPPRLAPSSVTQTVDTATYEFATMTGPYWANYWRLARKEGSLTQNCMRQLGYVYFPANSVSPTDTESAVEIARNEGYGIHPPGSLMPQGDVDSDQEDRYIRSLSGEQAAQYNAALFGAESARRSISLPDGSTMSYPAQGCIAEARVKLYGSGQTAALVMATPQALLSKIDKDVASSPEAKTTQEKWRVCMRRAGYPYQSTFAAKDSLKKRYASDGVTAALQNEEIATAVADAKCEQSSGAAAIYSTPNPKYFDALPQSEQTLLHSLRVARDRALGP